MFFNGGKMQHVFAFDEESRRYKEDGSFFSPEAENALHSGVLFYKIDGSNGMVQVVSLQNRADEEMESTKSPISLRAFQRLDLRGSSPNDDNSNTIISLPEGKNPASYTGHSYYYAEITTDVPGKKQVKRNRAMLELVTRHAHKFAGMEREWISVEWVGTMFNKTPGVDRPIALAIHDEQLVEECHSEPAIEAAADQDTVKTVEKAEEDTVETDSKSSASNPLPVVSNIERSYEGIRKFLLEDCADRPIEGLILKHEGVYWKIRCDAFALPKGTKDPFRKNRKNAIAPVYLV